MPPTTRYRFVQSTFGADRWRLVRHNADADLAARGAQLASQGLDVASLPRDDAARLLRLLRSHPDHPDVRAADMAAAQAIWEGALENRPPDPYTPPQVVADALDAELRELLSRCDRVGPVPPIDLDVRSDVTPGDPEVAAISGRVLARLDAAGLSWTLWRTNARGGRHVDVAVEPDVRHPDLLRLVGAYLADVLGNAAPRFSDHRRKDDRPPVIWDDSLYNHLPTARGRMWRLPGSAKEGGEPRELLMSSPGGRAISMADLAPYIARLEADQRRAEADRDRRAPATPRAAREAPITSVPRVAPQPDASAEDLEWLAEQTDHLQHIAAPGSSSGNGHDYFLSRRLLEAGADLERTVRLVTRALSSDSSRRRGGYVARTVRNAARHHVEASLGIEREEAPAPTSCAPFQDPHWMPPVGLADCPTRVPIAQRHRQQRNCCRVLGVPCGSINCGHCGPKKLRQWLDRLRRTVAQGGLIYRRHIDQPRTKTGTAWLRRMHDGAYVWIDHGDGTSTIWTDAPVRLWGVLSVAPPEGLEAVWRDLKHARDHRPVWQGAVAARGLWAEAAPEHDDVGSGDEWETLGTMPGHFSLRELRERAADMGARIASAPVNYRGGLLWCVTLMTETAAGAEALLEELLGRPVPLPMAG